MGHYVYILRSLKDSSLYVGQTRNVQQRLARHNDPREKSYTSKRGPWELVYSEEHPNRSSAVQRETFLKSCAGGNLVPVKITSEHDNGGSVGEIEKSGKPIRVKSPQRLRKCLSDAKTKPAKRILTKAEYEAEANQDAPVAKKRDTGERAVKDGKKLSLIRVAAIVLEACERPMTCGEIISKAIESNAWKPGKGLTPANTLSAAIRREINVKGDASRFRLAERGKFELNR
ncbi:MAG: GIY-YIG nuclease family protein [Phycisphaerae bacterium]|nr:GIY-YIG nuclease family protein [Phycisphaerae bacterium]